MSVRVFAPAKINLSLQVGAVRDDGYHPIESLVVFADVGDWVEAAPAGDLTLEIGGPFASSVSAGEDNLVLRAARVLAAEAGVEPRARLSLHKELPVASGIGGGSSDAAAALKALNVMWGLSYPEERLMQIAAKLGADAPVCVAARSAWMSGVGERVAVWRTPPLPAVLVNPMKPLATAAVFRAFDSAGLASTLTGAAPPSAQRIDDSITLARTFGNDLAAPARRLIPDIGDIEATLRDPHVRFANLSGSGATVFALLDSADFARKLADEIPQSHPHWWVRATTLAST